MFWFFAPSADARLAGAVPAWRLEEISSESQRAYHLTRPQAWTLRQIAEHLSTQPVAYNHRSPGEQRATLLAEGLPPLVADLLVGLDQVSRFTSIREPR